VFTGGGWMAIVLVDMLLLNMGRRVSDIDRYMEILYLKSRLQ